jgi:hypothetical protein
MKMRNGYRILIAIRQGKELLGYLDAGGWII